MSKTWKLMVVLTIVCMVVTAASARTFPNKRDMLGKTHDLTGYTGFGKTATWALSNGAADNAIVDASAVCSYCHTAHDNTGTADRTWLWIHPYGTATYTPYTSPTLTGTENITLVNESAKCLSCHDGTVALSSGAYGTAPTTGNYTDSIRGTPTQLTTAGILSYAAYIVPTVRTHPVSIAYTTASAPLHNMNPPASTSGVDAAGNIPLYSGEMECGTCHEVHSSAGGVILRVFPTGPGLDAPATAAQGSNAFCLYCHL